MKRLYAAAFGGAAVLVPAVAAAHFILVSPQPTLQQNRLGDPQKLGPCGGTSADPGTPTGMVSEMKGGEMLHIKVQETVFHPGHFRVALAVKDRSELPADPETMTREGPRGPISVSAKVDMDPKPPVLADGLFTHTERAQPGTFYEADVKLPNINCAKCTVQVIQWMGEHGRNPDGDFTYHHCAEVKITADPKAPIDRRWPGQ